MTDAERRPPQSGDLVVAEIESLSRIVADIDAWCEATRNDPPIDFICDLRERLDGLRRYQEAAAVAPGIAPRERARKALAGTSDDVETRVADAIADAEESVVRATEHEIRTLREQLDQHEAGDIEKLGAIGYYEEQVKLRDEDCATLEAREAATRAALIALRDQMQAEYNDCFVTQRTTQIWSVTLKAWIDALTQAAGLPDAQEAK